MKVKVIKEFMDRQQKFEHRYIGNILELEEKRAKELISGGYVEEIIQQKKPKQ